MMFKRLIFVIIVLLMGVGGVLAGCSNPYARMRLLLSTNDLILYMPQDGVLDEENVRPSTGTFSATVTRAPKKAVKSVTYMDRNEGIVRTEQEAGEDGETLFTITALSPGRTTLYIKTTEGAKEEAVEVHVIKEVQNITYNTSYKPAVLVGSSTDINTAQAISFSPSNTNQKDIIYTLAEPTEGVTLTEAGNITVTQKTANFITVIATSRDKENLSVSFDVKIIEPIGTQDVILTTDALLQAYLDWLQLGEEGEFDYSLSHINIANNVGFASQSKIKVEVNSSEQYNISVSSSNSDRVQATKESFEYINLRSITLGAARIFVRVEIVGYEDFFITKYLDVDVVNLVTEVLVNGLKDRQVVVYDSYAGVLGRELRLRVSPTNSHSRQIRLFVAPEDLNKITIRFSDGSILAPEDINEVILPNDISIYIEANEVVPTTDPQVIPEENLVNIQFIANHVFGAEFEVRTTIELKLTEGASDLVVPNYLIVQYGQSVEDYPVVNFEVLPSESAIDGLIVEVENPAIATYQKISDTRYRFIAIDKGTSRVWVTTSNGIRKSFNLEVFIPLDGAALSIDTPSLNHNVAEIELDSTPNNYESLVSATVAVGAGLRMNLNLYPAQASIVNVTYSSSNPSIASVSSSGYLVTSGIGSTTITAKITWKRHMLISLGDGTYQVVPTQYELIEEVKTFNLKTYIPILDMNLSERQIDLYDANYLGYYDLGKSQHPISAIITPSNATFKDNIDWVVSSPYLSIQNGILIAQIPSGVNIPNNILQASVTATIIEYGRYYSKTTIVTVRRPVKVEDITVFNVPSDYLYFDVRNGTGPDQSKQLQVQTYPHNATNSKVRYVYVQDPQDTNPNPVFTVNAQGKITPVRAGIARVDVVAEDSFISESEYSKYSHIFVKVADGKTKETALEVLSVQDLMAINTIEGLKLHYVLASNIDLSAYNFTPIGKIGGIVHPFTGSINGRFTYGSIDNQYSIRGFSLTPSSSEHTSYFGLVAKNEGDLENINLEINLFSTKTTNNSAGSTAYIGGLTGLNNGVIKNARVTSANSLIEIGSRTAYVGVIAGYNTNEITNPIAWGVVNVRNLAGVSTVPNVLTGAITAYNEGTILGEHSQPYDLVEENPLLETEYRTLYQKQGINVAATIDTTNANNSANSTGLAVGVNYGIINKISTDGVVLGLDNVGGLVGLNFNLVENSISSSQVEGRYNVGGLIGHAAFATVNGNTYKSSIKNNSVEMYDRVSLDQMATIAIKGVNNVGGLIGKSSGIEILEFNYVNSYITRIVGANYLADIVLEVENSSANFFVGGLIGQVDTNNIAVFKNFAKVNIAQQKSFSGTFAGSIYIGGLIGGSSESTAVEYSYFIGSATSQEANSFAGGLVGKFTSDATIQHSYTVANLTANTTNALVASTTQSITQSNNISNDNYASWNIENSDIWYLDATGVINAGRPVLYINSQRLLINQAPQAVEVTVKDQQVNIDPGNGKISFNHLKVSNKRAVVMLREDGGTYTLSDIIQTSPVGGRYLVTTTSNDLIQILNDGQIRPLKEGTATIRISSILNLNVYDTFEIAIVKGFDNFSLSTEQDGSSGQIDNKLLPIKLEQSVILYSALTNSTYSNYTPQAQAGVIYRATTADFTVNGYDLNAEFTNTLMHILYGRSSSEGELQVSVTPYLSVMFGEEIIKVEISQLQKNFKVSVFRGATSITTDITQATIALRQEINLMVYLSTDSAEEMLEVFAGYVKEEQEHLISEYVSVELVKKEEVVENKEYIYHYLIKATPRFLEVGSGSNFKSEKTGEFTFISSSNPELSTIFKITIAPEELLRIDVEHFASGETQIVGGLPTYYPQELPSDIIAPGQPGLLKIGLFPEYANVDYYEITSSQPIAGSFVSLEQLTLTKASGQEGLFYAPLTPGPALIPFGTTLRLVSTADRTGETIKYDFDGNIYVKTLIASSVPMGTKFIITITGYKLDQNQNPIPVSPNKEIELLVEALPGIDLSYNDAKSGEVARGSKTPLTLVVSDEYDGIIDVRAQITSIDKKDMNGANDITVKNSIVNYVNITEQNGQYMLDVGPAVPSGSVVLISARVSRVINGMLEEKISEIELRVVDFVISSITIDQAQSGSINTYVGGSFRLGIGFNLVPSSITSYNNDWNMHLNTTEQNNMKAIIANVAKRTQLAKDDFSRNLNTWHQRTVSSGDTVDTSLAITAYDNFSVYQNRSETLEYSFSGQQDNYLRATRISSNTTIAAKINFYYDANGQVQSVFIEDNQMLRYPQAHISDVNEEIIVPDDVRLYNLAAQFRLNISSNSTLDKPVPIYNVEELRQMQEGVDYILHSNKDTPLVLENWVPLNTAIKSLDGNGRIIQIKSFAPNASEGTYNFGLFGTLQVNTVLKNIKIDIGPLMQEAEGIVDATEFNVVNFGFVAGINNGTIHNVDVFSSANSLNNGSLAVNLITNSSAITNFGGLVAYNAGGYITNSRVGRTQLDPKDAIDAIYEAYPVSLKSRGIVAGFVSHNTGVITTSYVANLTLENTSTASANRRTAGFVAFNASNGRINQSYVEGWQHNITNRVIQGGGLSAVGTIGGFVHENQGIIEDSFTNIPITTQSRSAGFVYTNELSGSIKNAYSASKIITSATAHMPFVGVNSLDQILNRGSIENTYYMYNSAYFTEQFNDYPAIFIRDFDREVSFTGFGFLGGANYEGLATWSISSGDSARPMLNAPNDIALSEREISSVVADEQGGIVGYNYKDADFTPPMGSERNPIIVSNAAQFIEALTRADYLYEEKDSSGDTVNKLVNNTNIRLIRDINFNEITNNANLLQLQRVTFAGRLDGNGMNLNNVRILSQVATGEEESYFGMFKQIGRTDAYYKDSQIQKTLVKNLNINISEISATDATYVGALSGVISNSVIMNVSISGQQITVQGKNLVGALAGKVTGDSRLINIESSVSVSAEYLTASQEYKHYKPYTTVIFEGGEIQYNHIPVDALELSYAGGIAGVIDLYSYEQDTSGKIQVVYKVEEDWETPKVNGLKVYSNAKIRAENAGGVVGYLGKATYAKNLLFEVSHSVIIGDNYQSIVGFNTAGGVVAENSGILDHSRIEHQIDYQENTIDVTPLRAVIGAQNLFRNTSRYTGGLVGYNNTGKIKDSYSRIDVVNPLAQVAGGLVGVQYGGTLDRVYATGHIVASNVIGGVIGTLSSSSLEAIDSIGNKATGDKIYINNAIAANNWQITAYQNIDETGVWRERIDGEWQTNTDKFMGAFIGKQEASTIILSYYSPEDGPNRDIYVANEVFSTLNMSLSPKKELRIVGNNSGFSLGHLQLVNTGLTDYTQLELITDLTNGETITIYQAFTKDYWTPNARRYPKLIFSNLEDVITVSTEQELRDNLERYKYKTFRIVNDIYLSKEWAPLQFNGTMIGVEKDGKLPTIYNLNISSSDQDVGFFSIMENASISNINFVIGGQENVTWQDNYSNGIIGGLSNKDIKSTIGTIAGFAGNSAIRNINIDFYNTETKFNSISQYTGLVVGQGTSITIESIKINYKEGVALNKNVLVNNDNTKAPYPAIYFGGLVGLADKANIGDINIRFIEVTINHQKHLHAGGIIGKAQSVRIAGEFSSDIDLSITTKYYHSGTQSQVYLGLAIGDISGTDQDQIANINVSGFIKITSNNSMGIHQLMVGGLVGRAYNVSIINSTYQEKATGITTKNIENEVVKIGGLIGYAEETLIKDSSAIVSIIVTGATGQSEVGGLVGHYKYTKITTDLLKNINNVYTRGSITINSLTNNLAVGGIVGSTFGSSSGTRYSYSIDVAHSQMLINAVNSSNPLIRVGGIVGHNTIRLYNTLSMSDLYVNKTQNLYVGGLVGDNSANIYNSYSASIIATGANNESRVNPSVGFNTTSVQLDKVYFDKDLSGLTSRVSNLGALSKSSEDLIDISVNTALGEQWTKASGTYPYLKNLVPDLSLGSRLKPIRISTSNGLASLNNSDKYFLQTADINYSTSSQTIENFNGVFNGNKKTITYNQTIATLSSQGALFNALGKGAIVSNLNLVSNLNINHSNNHNAHLAGLALYNNGVIFGVYSKTSITKTSGASPMIQGGVYAGLVAWNWGIIESSGVDFNMNIDMNSSVGQTLIGGISGYISESIESYISPRINISFSTGLVQGTTNDSSNLILSAIATGFTGQNIARLENSYSSILFRVKREQNYISPYFTLNFGVVKNSSYDRYTNPNYSGPGANYTASMSDNANFVTQLNSVDGTSRFNIFKMDKRYNHGYPYHSFILDNNIYNSGNGTYSNPYQINHAGRLDWVRTQLSSANYFKQTVDIDLAGYSGGYFTPIGTNVTASESYYGSTLSSFSGIYDGQNKTIQNLTQYYYGSQNIYSGLFRSLEGGEGNFRYGHVYNVRLTGVNISVSATATPQEAYLGAIAGKAYRAEIVNSSVQGVVESNRKYNEAVVHPELYAGGLVGAIDNTFVNISSSDITLTTHFGMVGGLVGSAYNSTIQNSQNIGEVSVRYVNELYITTANYYLGGIVGYSEATILEGLQNNANKLNAVTTQYIGYNYVDYFNTNSLKNLGTGGIVGLINGGSLKNSQNNAAIEMQSYNYSGIYVGGVAGYIIGLNQVENLQNNGAMDIKYASGDGQRNGESGNNFIGGITGFIYRSSTGNIQLKKLSNTATIAAQPMTFNGSYRYGGNLYLGGTVGRVNSTITSTQYGQYLNAPTEVIDSYNTGNIEAKASRSSHIGGIVGYTNYKVTNSYNTGNIASQTTEFLTSKPTDYNPKSTTYTHNVGGIIGQVYDNNFGSGIFRSYNTGQIWAKNENSHWVDMLNVGGLAGYFNGGTVSESYNTGSIFASIRYVIAEGNIGGIIGSVMVSGRDSNFRVINTYNTGEVKWSEGYTTGVVAGGIIGYYYSSSAGSAEVDKVYNIGEIRGSTSGEQYDYFTGAIIGFGRGTNPIGSHYYDSAQGLFNAGYMNGSGSSNINKDYARTLAQLKQQNTYTGWNFSTIWTMTTDNTPTLRYAVTILSNTFNFPPSIPSLHLSSVKNVTLKPPTSGGGDGGWTPGGPFKPEPIIDL